MNRLPKSVVISCSHNVVENEYTAIEKKIKSFRKYLKNGSKCVSLKFQRSKDDEEYKFGMELTNNVLVSSPQIFKYVLQDMSVHVVGPVFLEELVYQKNKFLYDNYKIKNKIFFVPEGEFINGKKKLSLSISIKKGFSAMNLKKNETGLFIPGDCPMDATINQWKDDMIKFYDTIIHLNPDNAMYYKNQKLYDRNFPRWIIDENGQKRRCKEGNCYVFSKNAIDGIVDIVDEIYKQRQGKVMNPFSLIERLYDKLDFEKFPNQIILPLFDIVLGMGYNKLLKLLGKENNALARKMGWQILGENSTNDWGCSSKVAEDFASWLIGKKSKITIKYSDPSMLRDIDAWHDLTYYRACVDYVKGKTEYDGLDLIFPAGKQLFEFMPYVEKIRDKIPVLKENYEKNKEKKYLEYLVQSEYDNFEKSYLSQMIKNTFRNIYNQKVLSDENIPLSVEYFKKKTKEFHDKNVDGLF